MKGSNLARYKKNYQGGNEMKGLEETDNLEESNRKGGRKLGTA